MTDLTMPRAREILAKHVTKEHLLTHSLAVSAAMGALAAHFNADVEHWQAIGYLHDVDYEKFPEQHCGHVAELLAGEGVADADIRAIISHGWGICSDVEPLSELERSLFTVDELTGIVSACALMRPTGISDMEVKSVKKKFRDHRFAAGCNRDIIQKGCDMLGMELGEVIELTIAGMREQSGALGLGPKE
ncbi:MAG: HDIG domain-containing protein [Bacillota bacterium]|nr:HDIG domain-containing protein [Bacillota bacterium]